MKFFRRQDIEFPAYKRRINYVFGASFQNTSLRVFGEELRTDLSSVLPVDVCVCVGLTIKKNVASKISYKMNLSYHLTAAKKLSFPVKPDLNFPGRDEVITT